MDAVVFIIPQIFFATRGICLRTAHHQKLLQRIKLIFLGVFSGTALSTSRFISSSVTKANVLISNLKPRSFGNWGISLGE